MKNSQKSIIAVSLSVVYLMTNVVGVYATEVSFWQERKKAANQFSNSKTTTKNLLQKNTLLAQLPSLKQNLLIPSTLQKEVSLGVGSDFYKLTKKNLLKQKGPLSQWFQSISNHQAALRDIYLPRSWKATDPLVVHIQDAHENHEAQRNIASVIQSLAQVEAARLKNKKAFPLVVGLEGARGEFNFEPYRTFPDQNITQRIAGSFLKDSFISGPEYVGFTTSYMPHFWGVEDESEYLHHVKVLREALPLQKGAQSLHNDLVQNINRLKIKTFNKDLKEFESKSILYQKGELSLSTYLDVLSLGKERKGKTIQAFLKAAVLEKELDFKKVEKERTALTKSLVSRLPKSDLDKLVSVSLSYRMKNIGYGVFYNYLKDLCQKHGVSLANYPQMDKYIGYVLLSETVKPQKLFKEIKSLEKRRFASLTKTKDEKVLVQISQDLLFFGKLVRFGLTSEEWDHNHSRQEEIKNIPKRVQALAPSSQSVVDGFSKMAVYFDKFSQFNLAAVRRNDSLTNNLLGEIKKAHKNSGTQLAILVAGGFHTEGITDILKEKKVAYAVLMPRISNVKGQGTDYLDAFHRDKTPLEKIFTGERITLKAQGGVAVSMGNEDLPLGTVLEKGFSGQGTVLLQEKLGNLDEVRSSLSEWLENLAKRKKSFKTIRSIEPVSAKSTPNGVVNLELRIISTNGKSLLLSLNLYPNRAPSAQRAKGVFQQVIGNDLLEISPASSNVFARFWSSAQKVIFQPAVIAVATVGRRIFESVGQNLDLFLRSLRLDGGFPSIVKRVKNIFSPDLFPFSAGSWHVGDTAILLANVLSQVADVTAHLTSLGLLDILELLDGKEEGEQVSKETLLAVLQQISKENQMKLLYLLASENVLQDFPPGHRDVIETEIKNIYGSKAQILDAQYDGGSFFAFTLRRPGVKDLPIKMQISDQPLLFKNPMDHSLIQSRSPSEEGQPFNLLIQDRLFKIDQKALQIVLKHEIEELALVHEKKMAFDQAHNKTREKVGKKQQRKDDEIVRQALLAYRSPTISKIFEEDKLNVEHKESTGETLTIREKFEKLDREYAEAARMLPKAQIDPSTGEKTDDPDVIEANIKKIRDKMKEIVREYYDIGKAALAIEEHAGKEAPSYAHNYVVALAAFRHVRRKRRLTQQSYDEAVLGFPYAPPENISPPLTNRPDSHINDVDQLWVAARRRYFSKVDIAEIPVENIRYRLGLSPDELFLGEVNYRGRPFQALWDMALALRTMMLDDSNNATNYMRHQAAEALFSLYSTYFHNKMASTSVDEQGGLSVPVEVRDIVLTAKTLEERKRAEMMALTTFAYDGDFEHHLKGHSLTSMDWLAKLYGDMSKNFYERAVEESLVLERRRWQPKLAAAFEAMEAADSVDEMKKIYIEQFPKARPEFLDGTLVGGELENNTRIEFQGGDIGDFAGDAANQPELYQILNGALALTRSDGSIGRNIKMGVEIRDRDQLRQAEAIDSAGKETRIISSGNVDSLDQGWEFDIATADHVTQKSVATLVLDILAARGIFPKKLLKKVKEEGQDEIEILHFLLDHVLGEGKGLAVDMHVEEIAAGSGLAVSNMIAMSISLALIRIMEEEKLEKIPEGYEMPSMDARPEQEKIPNVTIQLLDEGEKASASGYYEVEVSDRDDFSGETRVFATDVVDGTLEVDFDVEDVFKGKSMYVRARHVEPEGEGKATDWGNLYTFFLDQDGNPSGNDDPSLNITKGVTTWEYTDKPINVFQSIINSQWVQLFLSSFAGTQDDVTSMGGILYNQAGPPLKGIVDGKEVESPGSVLPIPTPLELTDAKIGKFNDNVFVMRVGLNDQADPTLEQVHTAHTIYSDVDAADAWAQLTLEAIIAQVRGDTDAFGRLGLAAVGLRESMAPVSITPLVIEPLEKMLKKYGHVMRYSITGARSGGSVVITFKEGVINDEQKREILKEVASELEDYIKGRGKLMSIEDDPQLYESEILKRGARMRVMTSEEMKRRAERFVEPMKRKQKAEHARKQKKHAMYKPDEVKEIEKRYGVVSDKVPATATQEGILTIESSLMELLAEKEPDLHKTIINTNASDVFQGFVQIDTGKLEKTAADNIRRRFAKLKTSQNPYLRAQLKERLRKNMDKIEKLLVVDQQALLSASAEGKVDLTLPFSQKDLTAVVVALRSDQEINLRKIQETYSEEKQDFRKEAEENIKKYKEDKKDVDRFQNDEFWDRLEQEKEELRTAIQKKQTKKRASGETPDTLIEEMTLTLLELAPNPEDLGYDNDLFKWSSTYGDMFGHKMKRLEKAMKGRAWVHMRLAGGAAARWGGGNVTKGAFPYHRGHETTDFLEDAARVWARYLDRFPDKRQNLFIIMKSAFTEDAIEKALNRIIQKSGLEHIKVIKQGLRPVVLPTEAELLLDFLLQDAPTPAARNQLVLNYDRYIKNSRKKLEEYKTSLRRAGNDNLADKVIRAPYTQTGLNDMARRSPTGTAGSLESVFVDGTWSVAFLEEMGCELDQDRLSLLSDEEQERMPLAMASMLVKGDALSLLHIQQISSRAGINDMAMADAAHRLLSEDSQEIGIRQVSNVAGGEDVGGIGVADNNQGVVHSLEGSTLKNADRVILEDDHTALMTGTHFFALKKMYRMLGYSDPNEYLEDTEEQRRERMSERMDKIWPHVIQMKPRIEELVGHNWDWKVLQTETVLAALLSYTQQELGKESIGLQEVTAQASFLDDKDPEQLQSRMGRDDAFRPGQMSPLSDRPSEDGSKIAEDLLIWAKFYIKHGLYEQSSSVLVRLSEMKELPKEITSEIGKLFTSVGASRQQISGAPDRSISALEKKLLVKSREYRRLEFNPREMSKKQRESELKELRGMVNNANLLIAKNKNQKDKSRLVYVQSQLRGLFDRIAYVSLNVDDGENLTKMIHSHNVKSKVDKDDTISGAAESLDPEQARTFIELAAKGMEIEILTGSIASHAWEHVFPMIIKVLDDMDLPVMAKILALERILVKANDGSSIVTIDTEQFSQTGKAIDLKPKQLEHAEIYEKGKRVKLKSLLATKKKSDGSLVEDKTRRAQVTGVFLRQFLHSLFHEEKIRGLVGRPSDPDEQKKFDKEMDGFISSLDVHPDDLEDMLNMDVDRFRSTEENIAFYLEKAMKRAESGPMKDLFQNILDTKVDVQNKILGINENDLEPLESVMLFIHTILYRESDGVYSSLSGDNLHAVEKDPRFSALANLGLDYKFWQKITYGVGGREDKKGSTDGVRGEFERLKLTDENGELIAYDLRPGQGGYLNVPFGGNSKKRDIDSTLQYDPSIEDGFLILMGDSTTDQGMFPEVNRAIIPQGTYNRVRDILKEKYSDRIKAVEIEAEGDVEIEWSGAFSEEDLSALKKLLNADAWQTAVENLRRSSINYNENKMVIRVLLGDLIEKNATERAVLTESGLWRTEYYAATPNPVKDGRESKRWGPTSFYDILIAFSNVAEQRVFFTQEDFKVRRDLMAWEMIHDMNQRKVQGFRLIPPQGLKKVDNLPENVTTQPKEEEPPLSPSEQPVQSEVGKIWSVDELLKAFEGKEEIPPFVTGGESYIGRELSHELLSNDKQTIVLARSLDTAYDLSGEFRSENVFVVYMARTEQGGNPVSEENLKKMEKLIKKSPMVYHVDSLHDTTVENIDDATATFMSNTMYTNILSAFVKKYNKKMVYVSTAQPYKLAFDNRSNFGAKEEDPPVTEKTSFPFSKKSNQFITNMTSRVSDFVEDFMKGSSVDKIREQMKSLISTDLKPLFETLSNIREEVELQAGKEKFNDDNHKREWISEQVVQKMNENHYPVDFWKGLYSMSNLIPEASVMGLSPGNSIVLRPTNIYGEGQRPGEVIPLLINILLEGKKTYITKNSSNFTNYKDYVRAITLAGEKLESGDLSQNETILIGGSENSISIIDLYRQLSEIVTGRKATSLTLLRLQPEEQFPHVSFEKAQKVLGWTPRVSLTEGLTEMSKKMTELHAFRKTRTIRFFHLATHWVVSKISWAVFILGVGGTLFFPEIDAPYFGYTFFPMVGSVMTILGGFYLLVYTRIWKNVWKMKTILENVFIPSSGKVDISLESSVAAKAIQYIQKRAGSFGINNLDVSILPSLGKKSSVQAQVVGGKRLQISFWLALMASVDSEADYKKHIEETGGYENYEEFRRARENILRAVLDRHEFIRILFPSRYKLVENLKIHILKPFYLSFNRTKDLFVSKKSSSIHIDQSRQKIKEFVSRGGKPNIVIIVGGTYLRVGVTTDEKPVYYHSQEWQVEETSSKTRDSFLKENERLIDETLAKLEIDPSDLGTVYYSWPGNVDDAGGVTAPAIPGFTTEDLEVEFRKKEVSFALKGWVEKTLSRKYDYSGPVIIKNDTVEMIGEIILRVQSKVWGQKFLEGELVNSAVAWPNTSHKRQIEDNVGEVGHHHLFTKDLSTGRTASSTYDPPVDGRFRERGPNEYFGDDWIAGVAAARRFVEELIRSQPKNASVVLQGDSQEILSKLTTTDDPGKRDKKVIARVHEIWTEKMREQDELALDVLDQVATDIGTQVGYLLAAYPKGYVLGDILGTGNSVGFWKLKNPNEPTRVILLNGFIEKFGRGIDIDEQGQDRVMRLIRKRVAEIVPSREDLYGAVSRSFYDSSKELSPFLAEKPFSSMVKKVEKSGLGQVQNGRFEKSLDFSLDSDLTEKVFPSLTKGLREIEEIVVAYQQGGTVDPDSLDQILDNLKFLKAVYLYMEKDFRVLPLVDLKAVRFMPMSEISRLMIEARDLKTHDNKLENLQAFANKFMDAAGQADSDVLYKEALATLERLTAEALPGYEVSSVEAVTLWKAGRKRGEEFKNLIKEENKKPIINFVTPRDGGLLANAVDISVDSENNIEFIANQLRAIRNKEGKGRVVLPLITNQDSLDVESLREKVVNVLMRDDTITKEMAGEMLDVGSFGKVVVTGSDLRQGLPERGIEGQKEDPKIQMDAELLVDLLKVKVSKALDTNVDTLPIHLFTDNVNRFVNTAAIETLKMLLIGGPAKVFEVSDKFQNLFKVQEIIKQSA